jgi:hypothetical protein
VLVGILQAGEYALSDYAPFEFSHCGNYGEHGRTHWRGCVQRLLVGNEVDSERAEFFQSQDQLFDTTGEAVEPPNRHDIESAAAGIDHEGVQPWPSFLSPAGPIGIHTVERPAALRNQLP